MCGECECGHVAGVDSCCVVCMGCMHSLPPWHPTQRLLHGACAPRMCVCRCPLCPLTQRGRCSAPWRAPALTTAPRQPLLAGCVLGAAGCLAPPSCWPTCWLCPHPRQRPRPRSGVGEGGGRGGGVRARECADGGGEGGGRWCTRVGCAVVWAAGYVLSRMGQGLCGVMFGIVVNMIKTMLGAAGH